MRSAALALIAALSAVPAAFAQDPPPAPVPAPAPAAPAKPEEKPAPAKPAAPAKHESKVTDAAKAAFEAARKVLHDPVAAGLKDLQGKVSFTAEFEGLDEAQKEQMEAMGEMKIDYTVDFRAPNVLKIEGKTDNAMMEMQLDQTSKMFERFFLLSLGVLEPAADAEYDADVVTVDGKKFLAFKFYTKNEAQGDLKLGLDANGLPGKGTMTANDPMSGMEQTIEVEVFFTKDGERFRFEKFVIQQPGLEGGMQFSASYADAGGFKLMSKTVAAIKTEMGSMKLGFKYDSLTVNGKKVELPKEEKKAEEKKAEVKPETPAAPVPDVEKKPAPPKEEPPK